MWLLLSLYFTLAVSSGTPSPLDAWRREIESAGASLAVARVVTDPARPEMRLDGEVLHRPLLVSYLLKDRFRAELVNAHALTVTHREGGQTWHFIVLNMARAAEWQPHEAGLLAHEFGHVWLESQGYRGVPFTEDEGACVAIHANDIVQHVLIRAEMRRRRIDGTDYWLSKLLPLIGSLERGEPPANLPPCGQLGLLSHWMDARLGLPAEDWTQMEPLAAHFAEAYPPLAAAARSIEVTLRPLDLAGREAYRAALESVYRELQELYHRLTPPRADP